MGGHPNLFNFSAHLNFETTSYSFIIIVAYLIFAEHVLSALDESFQSSAYHDMIKCLYKELVTMGVSSFILSMFLFSGLGTSDWIIHLVGGNIPAFFKKLIAICSFLFFYYFIFLTGINNNAPVLCRFYQ